MPTRKALGLVDQTVVDGVERQFEAVGDSEFIEDVVEMVFYGLLGDEKSFADFFCERGLGGEPDIFPKGKQKV
jgi:hypothetical protein